MSLKAKVKVGRITNLSEARYCAGMGVDLLGFPVGNDGLKPEQYKQLIEWVAGPEFVLELHRSQQADLKYITDNYPGHYIEIGANHLDWLQDESLSFIVALSPVELDNVREKLTGKGNVKVLEILEWNGEQIQSAIPLFLETDKLDAAMSANAGISLIGADEEKPGIKEYNNVADILEALEVE